jgi:hypothetical protein
LRTKKEYYSILIYRGKHITIPSDFSAQTLKDRKEWSNTIQTLRKYIYQPRKLYPAKLFFNLDGEMKPFQDHGKLKWFMSTKPALQRILKEIIHKEEEKNNHEHERSGKNKVQNGN